MRGRLTMMLAALVLMSCSKEDARPGRGIDYEYGRELKHEMIVLGDRLENPYKTENIARALRSLYPTKADRVDVKTTNLYVRFLPADDSQYEQLVQMGVEMVDHPLDYDIVVDGDWYHDPEIPEDDVTWQYAVVAPDFKFPDIRYEIIDECHISENNAGTRAEDGIDWQAVEREAYVLTGNSDRLESAALTKAETKMQPSGRITIVDEHSNGGKPFGVAGVRVSCNSFVKFDNAYTDRDGYYRMEKSFASDLRYRLVFKNESGFSIGLNMVLVPASVSTLGEAGPQGVNMTVTKDSEMKLYKRCVVNNAVYDYISRCAAADLALSTPPKDLRLWIFHNFGASSAMMLHHGALLDNQLIRSFLGNYATLIEYFVPDITLGLEAKNDYRGIYSVTCHELAHSSHFSKVGTSYWDTYIRYIAESYVLQGAAYGDGSLEGAGHCEIGEMWAYYLESKMYKERYGGSFPSYGTSYWFYPQIFRYLDERGLTASEIFSVLDNSVTSKTELKSRLLVAYPNKRTIIEQVFSRY